jgi:hypothetical protein
MRLFKSFILLLCLFSLSAKGQTTQYKTLLDTVKYHNDFIIKLRGDSLTVTLFDQPVPVCTSRQLDDYMKNNLKKITKRYILFDDDSGTPPSELADSITYLLMSKYKIKRLVYSCTCF